MRKTRNLNKTIKQQSNYTYSFIYNPTNTYNCEQPQTDRGNMQNKLQNYHNYLCRKYDNHNTIKSLYTSARQLHKYIKGRYTPQNIKQYIEYCRQHYQSNDSIRTKLNAMNTYLNHLNHPELTTTLPKPSNTLKPTLTDEEITKMLQVSRYDEETHLITLLIWEGCLRPDAIIHIKTYQRQNNKLTITHHKTKKHIGDKHIIMSNQMQQTWDNYLRQRPKPNKGQEQYLLICRNQPNHGNRYQNIKTIEDRISRLATISGVHRHVTPFMIRRTSSTLRQDPDSRYYAGDSKIVQNMFSHTTLAQTMKYNNKTDRHIERYLDRIYASDLQTDKYLRGLDKSYKSAENTFKSVDETDDNCSFSFSFSFDSPLFGDVQAGRNDSDMFLFFNFFPHILTSSCCDVSELFFPLEKNITDRISARCPVVKARLNGFCNPNIEACLGLDKL